MVMRLLFLPMLLLFLSPKIVAQTSLIDGYVFENNNRGYLNQAKIQVFRLPENTLVGEAVTDVEGHFSVGVGEGRTFRIFTRKDVFETRNDTVELENGKAFLKIELRRKPGYLFDVTLAERRIDDETPVDAIQNATIEVYNRTLKKPELVLKEHPNPGFQFTFEQGNKYTLMIRKNGYLTRRIDANVAVEGCILCIDGVSDLRPGVTENLTENNSMGTLLANLDMEKADLNRKITLKNIYYDYDKWFIRPDAAKELAKAVLLLKDNPGIKVELGSHTDARGSDDYNASLSQKRAESAVAWIVENGIDQPRITAKGYGESQLSNRCKDGAKCSEEEHQLNRRTELKITGILDDPRLRVENQPSLEEIVREEEFAAELKKLESGSQEFKMEDKSAAGGGLRKTEMTTEKHAEATLPDSKMSQPIAEKKAVSDAAKTGVPVPLAANFTGFASEIMRSDLEITEWHPYFKDQLVWYSKDADGQFSYFVYTDYSVNHARRYYLDKVIADYPDARLVAFKKGVKTYTK